MLAHFRETSIMTDLVDTAHQPKPTGDIDALHNGLAVPLPEDGPWPEALHLFGERESWAVKAAEAAGRPLLVRGEPGTGKSQLARAVACFTGRLFIPQVVHSRTEPEDLKWQFDAVARLGEAQALGAIGPTKLGKSWGRNRIDRGSLRPERFLTPGPLWWAFDYAGAEQQNARCHHPCSPPNTELGDPERGVVLLIDEIDKAEADLPNGLLEVLGNRGFSVPYRREPVCRHRDRPVLVLITTNEERELPGAFVRRCLVLRLELEKEETAFIDQLAERGARHFPRDTCDLIRRQVACMLWKERGPAKSAGLTPPGQAEYLDILRALAHLTEGVENSKQRVGKQLDLLEKIADFALIKKPPDA
jgi:MoxR-like ATPase